MKQQKMSSHTYNNSGSSSNFSQRPIWESSFHSILSETKENISRINVKMGNPGANSTGDDYDPSRGYNPNQ